jgi:hypothetical protein
MVRILFNLTTVWIKIKFQKHISSIVSHHNSNKFIIISCIANYWNAEEQNCQVFVWFSFFSKLKSSIIALGFYTTHNLLIVQGYMQSISKSCFGHECPWNCSDLWYQRPKPLPKASHQAFQNLPPSHKHNAHSVQAILMLPLAYCHSHA